MSLRYRERDRKPTSCPSLESPSPWRSRIFCVLLGITAGALAHHSLADSEKIEKPENAHHEVDDASHHSSKTEEDLADKLTQCKSALSQQSLKIFDLRAAQRDQEGCFLNPPKPEENEGSMASGEDLIASSDQGYYLTDILSGVEVFNDFEKERYAVVVRDVPIIWLRNEASKIDMPDDAKRSLESLFGAVADYQARPGDLTSRCDMTVAVETIENSLDEDAMDAVYSSPMLNMLLKSVKHPGINMEELRNDFCDE